MAPTELAAAIPPLLRPFSDATALTAGFCCASAATTLPPPVAANAAALGNHRRAEQAADAGRSPSKRPWGKRQPGDLQQQPQPQQRTPRCGDAEESQRQEYPSAATPGAEAGACTSGAAAMGPAHFVWTSCWTEDAHKEFLNLMEADFVRRMYSRQYCHPDICGVAGTAAAAPAVVGANGGAVAQQNLAAGAPLQSQTSQNGGVGACLRQSAHSTLRQCAHSPATTTLVTAAESTGNTRPAKAASAAHALRKNRTRAASGAQVAQENGADGGLGNKRRRQDATEGPRNWRTGTDAADAATTATTATASAASGSVGVTLSAGCSDGTVSRSAIAYSEGVHNEECLSSGATAGESSSGWGYESDMVVVVGRGEEREEVSSAESACEGGEEVEQIILVALPAALAAVTAAPGAAAAVGGIVNAAAAAAAAAAGKGDASAISFLTVADALASPDSPASVQTTTPSLAPLASPVALLPPHLSVQSPWIRRFNNLQQAPVVPESSVHSSC